MSPPYHNTPSALVARGSPKMQKCHASAVLKQVVASVRYNGSRAVMVAPVKGIQYDLPVLVTRYRANHDLTVPDNLKGQPRSHDTRPVNRRSWTHPIPPWAVLIVPSGSIRSLAC